MGYSCKRPFVMLRLTSRPAFLGGLFLTCLPQAGLE